ncbi:hypothetical protein Golob_025813 [Gossypium lobatum]|uniref:Uncharacterized protein n=1 Tax=Gossypium lobatum TaxID=34289 RepID=A0A7J8LTG2_9ROSI|nr:hypothetical protein [Gossypium lobatum]
MDEPSDSTDPTMDGNEQAI